MSVQSGAPASSPLPAGPVHPRFLGRPVTRLGRWAFGLGAAFMVLWIINSVVFMPSLVFIPARQVILPSYGIFMMLCGLAAGIVGLVAVISRHERSWLIWLSMLPGLLTLLLLVVEFLFPH